MVRPHARDYRAYRSRLIRQDLYMDPALSACGLCTRFVFTGLFTLADDEGRLVDSERTIDAFLFPLTPERSGDSLAALMRMGYILRYMAATGEPLIQIVDWSRWQRVEHPTRSKLPPPSDSDLLQFQALAAPAPDASAAVDRLVRKASDIWTELLGGTTDFLSLRVAFAQLVASGKDERLIITTWRVFVNNVMVDQRQHAVTPLTFLEEFLRWSPIGSTLLWRAEAEANA